MKNMIQTIKLLHNARVMFTLALSIVFASSQAQVEKFSLSDFGGNVQPIPQNFCEHNNSLYFTARNANSRYVLWEMNTELKQFKELSFSSIGGNLDPNPTFLTHFNNALYFSAADTYLNRMLWKLDDKGIAKVSLIDFGTGTNPYVSNLFAFGENLFFNAKNRNGDLTYWKMNKEGIASEINFESFGGNRMPDVKNYHVFNNNLYFNAKNIDGINVLWKFDGQTYKQIALPKEIAGTNPNPKYLTSAHGNLFFSAIDNRNNTVLWQVDANDVVKSVDLFTSGSSINPTPEYLCFAHNYLYFKVTDINSNVCLWRIDANNKVEKLQIIEQGGSANPIPNFMTQVDDNLYFRARDKNNNWHLWYIGHNGKVKKIPFTDAGGDLNPAPNNFFELNGKLYFSAKDKNSNYQLWRFTNNFVSSSWNGNWSNGLPNRNTDVTIESDFQLTPEMANFECLDLDIAANTSFEVSKNATATVYGNVLNKGQFEAQGDGSNSGSIIFHGEVNNKDNGQMYMNKSIVYNWNLMSSPMKQYYYQSSDYHLYSYVENSIGNKAGWFAQEPNFDWNTAKGYLLNTNATGSEIEFTGLFNSESIEIPINKQVYGFNLVGNPYPSALNWASSDWKDKGNVSSILYSYSNDLENYTYFAEANGEFYPGGILNNATGIIEPMQAFFVLAKSSLGSFKISNLAKVHSKQNKSVAKTYKTIEYFVLKVKNQNYSDETSIRFIPSTGAGFDAEYDALKLFSFNSQVPQLFTYTDVSWNSLAINSQNKPYAGLNIPIGFKAPTGSYTISAKEFNFTSNLSVVLKDNKLNIEVDLTNLNYTFQHGEFDDPARFVIYFKTTVGIEKLSQFDGTIYSSRNELFVSTDLQEEFNIEVYDIRGSKLYSDTFSNEFHKTFDFATGNYIVKLNSQTGSYVKKIYFQN